MPVKTCGTIFFNLPVRNTASSTGLHIPFVPQPSPRPTVQGVFLIKLFITVGGNLGYVTTHLNSSNTMKFSATRWPEFNFVDDIKQPDSFPIKTFLDRFTDFFFQRFSFLQSLIRKYGGESGSCTRLHGFRVHVITSDPPSAYVASRLMRHPSATDCFKMKHYNIHATKYSNKKKTIICLIAMRYRKYMVERIDNLHRQL